MAVLTHSEIPFGLRDCKIYPLTGDTPGTAIDVPRIQTVELGVETDSTELNGDDVRVAIHTFNKRMTGTFQAGGVNIDTLEVLEGGIATTGGVTPNVIVTYAVVSTNVQGYFQLIAQLIGDDAGDIHLKAYKTKMTSGPSFAPNQGEFLLTTGDIEAVFNGAVPGKLYDLIAHETVTAIV